MARRLLSLARRAGVERQALAVRRRLLPAHVRRDIRDHELLVLRLEEALKPDSDCVDVGAHRGSVLRELVRLSPQGRHVAWEPLPGMAALLRDEFPSVYVREAALSDRQGQRDFAHVVDSPAWSGFEQRSTPGSARVETITVRSERLDDALPEDVKPEFLKIDVEGAELEVLRGGLATLRRHRPLIAFEHGHGSADYYGTRPTDVYDVLVEELGYAIYGLDGDGPYGSQRFADMFSTGERVNFLARPSLG